MEATIGGTRRHLVDLAGGQQARGHEVHLAVATARDPGFPADLERLEGLGVGVTRIPMARSVRPGRDWADYRALCRLVRELHPDIVHSHSSKAGVLGRLASLRTGVGRRVHTPHTFAFLFGALFGPLQRAVYRSIESGLARRTERLIAVSPSEGESFERSRVVSPDRVRVVPNGIDPGPFEAAEALDVSRLGLDPEQPGAVVIGLVYAAKGQDLALECLAAPGLERLQIIFAGPGELEELRAQAARLGVDRRVRVLGPRDDVPRLLAAADFLLLPSRWEGMPYVVMEAMAAAKPVVATPVDGARDLIVHGSTGRRAARIAAPALAEEIGALLACDADQRAAMGRAGQERVRSSFSVDTMVEGTLAVYRELA
jgi:glycosyltransferase involved in cell wall biosynthesis